MGSKLIRDDSGVDYVDGVDRHYYEKQVPASSPFGGDNSFQLAAAIAKDKARHKLIRAIQQKEIENRGNFLGAQDREAFIGNGTQSFTDSINGEPNWYEETSRSIDGRNGASLDDIKL